MPLEIRAVGGYQEVGKNMTAINVDGEVVIIDMGIHIPNYIGVTEDDDVVKLSTRALRDAGAIPDDGLIYDWQDRVKAILITHGHLDHVAGVPYLAERYDCPVITTPFTCAVLRRILKDEHIDIPNRIEEMTSHTTRRISDKIEVVFVHVQHSIPQTVLIALRTPYGIVTYSNDLKLDNTPVIGKPPDYAQLEALGEEGVHTSIVNCLYADEEGHTPSEQDAQKKLKDVLLKKTHQKGVIVTTFSSHIARLKSITEFGKQMGRKVVFLGRSLAKYTSAAQETGIYDFTEVKVVRYPREIQSTLKRIMRKGKDKYLIVCTGHQGEPKAILSRLAREETPYVWDEEDTVIFSSKVISAPINKTQSAQLEQLLRGHGVKIFREVHASGHASRDDLKRFLKLLQPTHVIPSHGITHMTQAMESLCRTLGMDKEHIHPIATGDTLILEGKV